MKPTIGRIVHYNFAPDVILPAMITKVWSDYCVNLKIFGNGSEVISDDVKTSVMHGDWVWPPMVKQDV